MKYLMIFLMTAGLGFQNSYPDAAEILKKVDKNLTSKNRVTQSQMVIYGRRNKRTIVSKGYGEGIKRSFTTYLAPAREKGTKMLKLEDRLWIYSPSTDRTIQLSGHMLRQSVMGSDLSYEDMMETRKLTSIYDAKVVGNEIYNNRKAWILKMVAKVDDVTYHTRKSWIDQDYFIPLKEELFAKSGQLLKQITSSDLMQVDGRWYPKKMNYKDVLKKGKGTDFIIDNIDFDVSIPDYIFTKAALKK